VTMLETLHASLAANVPVETNWLLSERAALANFLESADRFNRRWSTYLENLDLESVNQPRRDFNQFYPVEKACAFGLETIAEGFEPLAMIDSAYLLACFPLLTLPSPA
jgi:hypothetical protein